jgi:hypothetical protein
LESIARELACYRLSADDENTQADGSYLAAPRDDRSESADNTSAGIVAAERGRVSRSTASFKIAVC